MKAFRGKVAVITGAASGIGRALAGRCAREGMRIVLADIEAPALAQAEAELKSAGADILAIQTDVSKAGDVEALAYKTLEAYGAVHLLCNNAGVGAGSQRLGKFDPRLGMGHRRQSVGRIAWNSDILAHHAEPGC